MSHSIRWSVLFVFAMIFGSASAQAAMKSGRLPLSSGKAGDVSILGETRFECGTYKGNEAEHAWRRAVDARVQKDVRSLSKSVQGGLDYIYDDIWIIEDDGTLTFSGTNQFDTNFRTFLFFPAGDGSYTVSSPALSFDNTLGTTIAPGDDGAVVVPLQFSFPFGGATWSEVYVSGNGIVSFGGNPNPAGFYDPADFYGVLPKIACFYLDLNHLQGGAIYTKSEATKMTITWSQVPEYGQPGVYNTFQLVMRSDGRFSLTYNNVQTALSSTGNPIIIGYHAGGSATLEPIGFSTDLPYVSGTHSAVYEEYYAFGTPLVNEVALFRRFYQQFPDEFFQLVFFTNFLQTMSGFANEVNIQNDVTGLGLDIFDASLQYGSNGVLESRCNMNRLAAWIWADPARRWFSGGNSFLTIMGQESGHRWGAFTYFDAGSGPSNLILGRSDAHWSYFADMDHSSLEGGNWVSTGGVNYMCPTQVDYFSELDEYLFGLRTPEEVTDFYYISSPSNDHVQLRSMGSPLINETASGSYVPVTVEHVAAANGARTPLEADENKDLRQGFILLLQQGTSPTQADLDKISGFRRAWEDYFEVACDGRLTCNTSLTATFDVAVVCGHVRNSATNDIVSDFTARSIERGFNQHVPQGGRYTFRYQANPSSGSAETATIVFQAANFKPDTVVVNASFGSTLCSDVLLEPIANPVLITNFEAVVRGAAVHVRWDLWSDEELERYTLYRQAGVDAPAVEVVGGRLDGAVRSYVDRNVEAATTYRYELVIETRDGDVIRSQIATATTPALRTSLEQNYPNPFNPKTTIEYSLADAATVALGIYDAKGALVVRLEQGRQARGTHHVEWNGRDTQGRPVGSGVYFYRLEGVKGIAPKKMVLLK